MARNTRQLKPLPGYPWNGKFQTMEEIQQYRDQPKLTCLLCGREYASLGAHLGYTHEMEADRYREMYGLPWTYSLAGRDWREVQGRTLRRTRANGKISHMPSTEHLQVMQRNRQNRRPAVEVARKAAATYLPDGRRPRVTTAPEMMEEYLRRIGTGRTISEVGRDEDMPSFQSFYNHCSENPDFQRRFEAIWDQLPFSVQLRGHRTGQRYKNTVIALRDEGKTWAEIGRAVGVQRDAATKAWHRWKKSDKADSPRSSCAL